MEEIKNEMNEMIPEKKKGNSNVALWIVCCLSLICSLVLMCVVFCKWDSKDENTKAVATNAKQNKSLTNGGLRVAYIDTDSVLAKYDMAKDM
ncbi:MAG: hypothetical protein U0L54_06370, partial [Bacteroidales bacterium]|nr:hypothetical protein [Bacteroidales bacterium]